MTRVRAWFRIAGSRVARWGLAAITGRATARRVIARPALVGGVAAVAVISTLLIATTASPGPAPQWLSAAPSPTPAAQPDPPPAHPRLRTVAEPVEISPTPAPPPPPVQPPVDIPDEVPPPPDPLPPPPPVPAGDFAGWAIMDTETGSITGSSDLHRTSTTASMIKAWLVADYLRRASEQPPPDKMDELSRIIRESNNEFTRTLYAELGYHSSIHRLISICGLTDSKAIPYYWSNTELSPRDTARMGLCLADGRAAGGWTQWLLDEMRQVWGLGDFGIRWAFPAGPERQRIAIKNGWVTRPSTGEYHVNCLAIGDGWTMGVMTRYPAHLGYQHGAEICRTLAEQHLWGD